jgi:4-amino-4-deoxy-L-arabinose transferase-like glycosyltransferase
MMICFLPLLTATGPLQPVPQGAEGPRHDANAGTSSLTSLGILAAATIACLLPWINKAFCIDDPLFLWAAAQIQAHPLDFYGCNVNWFSTVEPLYDVMKNPPLACYYLAGAAAVVGCSEPALHAVFLLPAVGAICGTWFVARSLCRQPVWAALIALVTPAFLVSSSNLMCDTMMVCLWTWAIGLWVAGLQAEKTRWLALASLSIAAAALAKYFAISLIPLLAIYTLLRKRGPTWRLAWLLVPVALLAAYQAWSRDHYGRGLLSDAASFAWGIAAKPGPGVEFSRETVWSKILVVLSFAGGSFLPVLFLAPWLLTKKGLLAAILLALAVSGAAWRFASPQNLAPLHKVVPFTPASAAQFGILVACGALVVWLGLSDLAKHQSADACLLAMWILGAFDFAGFVNWTCNVRSLLPIAPAFGILVMRRLEAKPVHGARGWRWALVPALVAASLVAWADFALANSARTAASQLAADLKQEMSPIWFQGHWGFQYYMEAQGGRDVDLFKSECLPDDMMITPYNNTDVEFYPQEYMAKLRDLEVPTCRWLSTLQVQAGAGFYSSIWGPMPFVFGPVPPEKYGIWRLRLSGDASPLPKDIDR